VYRRATEKGGAPREGETENKGRVPPKRRETMGEYRVHLVGKGIILIRLWGGRKKIFWSC